MNENEIIIKFSDLKTAINDCYNHVNSLLKTAKHLHHNSQYENSIFFTIIAFEEFGKLCTYNEYYKKQIGIPRREIKKLTKHPYKLKKLINYYESSIIGLTETQYNVKEKNIKLNFGLPKTPFAKLKKSTIEIKEFFTSLDYVKQFILYYDFKEGRSLTLSHQITKNNMGHFSLFLLEFVVFFINYEHVRFTYPKIIFTIPENENIIADDPSWKNCKDFAKRIRSDKFQSSIRKSVLTVKEIKLFYEELRRRNLLIK